MGSAATGHRIVVEAAHAVAAHDQNRGLEMAVAASIAQGHGGGSGATLNSGLFDSAPAARDSPRTRCLKQLFGSTQLYLSGDLRSAIAELRAALETGRLVDDVDVLGNLGNAALHVGDDHSHREFGRRRRPPRGLEAAPSRCCTPCSVSASPSSSVGFA